MEFYKILPDGITGFLQSNNYYKLTYKINPNNPLKDPPQHGTWVDVDDKTYMFSFPADKRTVKIKPMVEFFLMFVILV